MLTNIIFKEINIILTLCIFLLAPLSSKATDVESALKKYSDTFNTLDRSEIKIGQLYSKKCPPGFKFVDPGVKTPLAESYLCEGANETQINIFRDMVENRIGQVNVYISSTISVLEKVIIPKEFLTILNQKAVWNKNENDVWIGTYKDSQNLDAEIMLPSTIRDYGLIIFSSSKKAFRNVRVGESSKNVRSALANLVIQAGYVIKGCNRNSKVLTEVASGISNFVFSQLKKPLTSDEINLQSALTRENFLLDAIRETSRRAESNEEPNRFCKFSAEQIIYLITHDF